MYYSNPGHSSYEDIYKEFLAQFAQRDQKLRIEHLKYNRIQ